MRRAHTQGAGGSNQQQRQPQAYDDDGDDRRSYGPPGTEDDDTSREYSYHQHYPTEQSQPYQDDSGRYQPREEYSTAAKGGSYRQPNVEDDYDYSPTTRNDNWQDIDSYRDSYYDRTPPTTKDIGGRRQDDDAYYNDRRRYDDDPDDYRNPPPPVNNVKQDYYRAESTSSAINYDQDAQSERWDDARQSAYTAYAPAAPATRSYTTSNAGPKSYSRSRSRSRSRTRRRNDSSPPPPSVVSNATPGSRYQPAQQQTPQRRPTVASSRSRSRSRSRGPPALGKSNTTKATASPMSPPEDLYGDQPPLSAGPQAGAAPRRAVTEKYAASGSAPPQKSFARTATTTARGRDGDYDPPRQGERGERGRNVPVAAASPSGAGSSRVPRISTDFTDSRTGPLAQQNPPASSRQPAYQSQKYEAIEDEDDGWVEEQKGRRPPGPPRRYDDEVPTEPSRRRDEVEDDFYRKRLSNPPEPSQSAAAPMPAQRRGDYDENAFEAESEWGGPVQRERSLDKGTNSNWNRREEPKEEHEDRWKRGDDGVFRNQEPDDYDEYGRDGPGKRPDSYRRSPSPGPPPPMKDPVPPPRMNNPIQGSGGLQRKPTYTKGDVLSPSSGLDGDSDLSPVSPTRDWDRVAANIDPRAHQQNQRRPPASATNPTQKDLPYSPGGYNAPASAPVYGGPSMMSPPAGPPGSGRNFQGPPSASLRGVPPHMPFSPSSPGANPSPRGGPMSPASNGFNGSRNQVAARSPRAPGGGGFAPPGFVIENGALVPERPRGSSHPTGVFQLPPKRVVRAIADYDAQAGNELSFSKGDFFFVMVEDNPSFYEVINPMHRHRGQVPRHLFEDAEASRFKINAKAFEDHPDLAPPTNVTMHFIPGMSGPPPTQQAPPNQLQFMPPPISPNAPGGWQNSGPGSPPLSPGGGMPPSPGMPVAMGRDAFSSLNSGPQPPPPAGRDRFARDVQDGMGGEILPPGKIARNPTTNMGPPPLGPPSTPPTRGPAAIISPNNDGFYVPDGAGRNNSQRQPPAQRYGPMAPLNTQVSRAPGPLSAGPGRQNPSLGFTMKRVLRVKVRTAFRVVVSPPSPAASPTSPIEGQSKEWRYKFDILFSAARDKDGAPRNDYDQDEDEDDEVVRSATLDRSHGELWALHLSLLKRFPAEAGRRNTNRRFPFAEQPPPPVRGDSDSSGGIRGRFGPTNTEAARVLWIRRYLVSLMRIPAAVMESQGIFKFFNPSRPWDVVHGRDEADAVAAEGWDTWNDGFQPDDDDDGKRRGDGDDGDGSRKQPVDRCAIVTVTVVSPEENIPPGPPPPNVASQQGGGDHPRCLTLKIDETIQLDELLDEVDARVNQRRWPLGNGLLYWDEVGNIVPIRGDDELKLMLGTHPGRPALIYQ
ncbi:bud emergence protein 1 [Phlyctochytrium planicorne]|nr:bud emergence protein 1 [Phlyctochytrium planicorne]